MSEIHFAEVDAGKMIQDARAELERRLGERLQPTDERYLLLAHFMMVIIGTYARIDEAGRQNLLRYAQGEVLDAIGERSATARLAAAPATTILRFTLTTSRAVSTVISIGTRATPDGRTYFATTQAITIPAGKTAGDAPAASVLSGEVSGEEHNGYPVDSITALVDPVPFVAGVSNTTTTDGGRGREEDDAYRERIRLAPTKYSTAGPADAYVYHAMSAGSEVLDASARRTGPGEVEVAVLLADSSGDSAAILDKVLDALNDRTVRPLTDRVAVKQADAIEYKIALTYFTPRTSESTVVQSVEGENGALQRYKQWQDYTLGRSINPDKLRALLYEAGVVRISLLLPEPLLLEAGQRAWCAEMTVTHEVAHDEA